MKYVLLVLAWLLSIFFGLLAVSMAMMGNLVRALLLLAVILLLLPPARMLLTNLTGTSLSWPVRTLAILGLLGIFVLTFVLDKPTSIYKSPEVEARFLEMYDERLESWPVPYEERFVDTPYGRVHVIVSGPEDAPPLLLLHASGVAGWSWLFNVGELSQHYRTYAIDTIGDAGKSVLDDASNFPNDRRAQAELYAHIADQLGVDKAYVVGASEGGFIGSNYAFYFPDRVRKLVLLGPMGYAGTTASVLRIMLVQFFPLKPIQESTVRWALGDSPNVEETIGEWFRLLMAGTAPKKARPEVLPPEQLQGLTMPVLLILGKNDRLVGDPENAARTAQAIPDLRVKVLDAGHMVGADQPEQVNALILEFLAEP